VTLKDILIHVDADKTMASRGRLAIDLARRHDAHLTGLCLAVDPVIPAAILGMVPTELFERLHKESVERAKRAAADFRATAERAGLAGDCRVVECLDGEIADALSLHARHADLMILGQGSPEAVSLVPALAADVALSCGRPTIVAPYVANATTLGEQVLVAWDGSREAARAVNDALPILERATSVTVLSVNPPQTGDDTRRLAGADIALHLARHGVKAEVASRVISEISVGDALLNEIADKGIDLLVMGAYGHSRLRELVLGGATRQILGSMTVPVLISH
jgi:nucleotide-binding universal stress UspA family protein